MQGSLVALLPLVLLACGSSAPKDVPSSSKNLEGFAVSLEVRATKVDKAPELTFDALARNDEKKTLIGLSVELELKRADGSSIQKIVVSPVSSREKVPVLEPGYAAPIHLKQRVNEAPASVVATITQAELYPDDADKPLPLDVKVTEGADQAKLAFASLGHFSVGGFSGAQGPSPFHLALGIKETEGAPLARAELQIVFFDDQGKPIDRIPVIRDFAPPLRPGDAVIETVSGHARPFAVFGVEVRALAKAD